MLVENFLSFIVVISVQLFFFVFHAVSVNRKAQVFAYLRKGMLLGLPFGIAADLFLGKVIFIHDYEIGFKVWFLIINGIFSYGFMAANVILLHRHSLHHMYLWSVGLASVYEITNYFFPVWEWTFGSAVMEYAVVILLLYAGLTWGMMLMLRMVYRIPFRLVAFIKL